MAKGLLQCIVFSSSIEMIENDVMTIITTKTYALNFGNCKVFSDPRPELTLRMGLLHGINF